MECEFIFPLAYISKLSILASLAALLYILQIEKNEIIKKRM